MTWSNDPDQNGDNADRKLLEEFAVWWNGNVAPFTRSNEIDTDDVARFLAERRR
jgi:hypothetical protein